MESRTYFVHSAQRYGCLTLALAALSCGSSHSNTSGGGGAGGSAGGATHTGGAANTGKAGTGGKGGATSAAEAGAAGASETEGGAAGSGGAAVAGSSASGGTSSSGAGDGSSGGTQGGGTQGGGTQGGGGGTPPVPANDLCKNATALALGATPSINIMATTLGAQHDIDAPCDDGAGADVFYSFDVSKRVLVYADTFGASWNTVLYLLTKDCTPIAATTTTGDAVCSSGACGGSQARIVALLEAGQYRLGLSGRAGAAGAAKIHFEFALAGSGSVTPLPSGSTMQSGSTVGSGDIQAISQLCLAAGPENSYWWSSCPSDAGGSLNASTCNGAAFETVLEVQLPASAPYTCSLDGCSLQSSISSTIPAGAGLRVLSVDGQGGSDKGAYTMTVSRP